VLERRRRGGGVTLVAAAVVPAAPLLVAPLAAGASGELDAVRAECDRAVGAVFAAEPDIVFVVGAESAPAATTLRPWGVDVPVDVPEPLPLALLVGGWLTRGRQRSFVVVDPTLPTDEYADIGRDLAGHVARVGLVAVGDGSARHTEKGPGYLHPQAPAFDDAVRRALQQADLDALTRLDREQAAELWVGGVPSWQVLAGAATGRTWSASATLSAPYGVGYHVASWT
jgi:hypothetical protein